MIKSYRILSLEACYICSQELLNGKDVGYKLTGANDDDDYWEFKNKLDHSLDVIELEKTYGEIVGEPFSFADKYGNEYTRAVINVKFKYTLKEDHYLPPKDRDKNAKVLMNLKQLRKHVYENGFCVEGVKYVRYKRSAGSSRSGKCLFIDKRLYDRMNTWSECGLTQTSDLASWEAYKALSLSSIKGTLDIPFDGILFVPDRKSKFSDEVVSVELNGDGVLVAEEKTAEIENNIWDGEGLLDESLFTGAYADKHMLLLRNKFFKSCAFRTKLQKWIKDNGITLDALKKSGCVTLAADVGQIVMVTTPSSLKYLKFTDGVLSEENVRRWASNTDGAFGVVKWDKRTRFFGGRMVRSSYQLLNTLGLDEGQVERLMAPSADYISTIRNDIDFMRYHCLMAHSREMDDDFDDDDDGKKSDYERAEVIFKLMNINNRFKDTTLYIDFRNDMVNSQRDGLRQGRMLLSGTNATLFGNGPELLKRIAGETEPQSELQPGRIRCGKFKHGQRLLCARSPHITMGNLYCVENDLSGGIWDYFDLGDNVVCVNAIGENIQQRLNGCDYDSDAMLITDDPLLVEVAEKYDGVFKVPVCAIESGGGAKHDLVELDYMSGRNKVGKIVNLSQKLNSIIWDTLFKGNGDAADIYYDVCKLAVLSGIEIDSAKRAYDVDVGKALGAVNRKYTKRPAPTFFESFRKKSKSGKDEENKDAENDADVTEKGKKRAEKVRQYNTAMEYIYMFVDDIKFNEGKDKFAPVIPVSTMLSFEPTDNAADLAVKDLVVESCRYYKYVIDIYRAEVRKASDDEKDVLYERIRDAQNARDSEIAALITNENIMYHVITYFETQKIKDWVIYAPLFKSKMFMRILKESEEKLAAVTETDFGKYSLYDFRFTKV